MERRLDAVRDLFDRQCKHHNIDYWSAWLLPFAKKVGKGHKLTLHISDHARKNNGQASEEAQGLEMLRGLGLDIVADDPAVIASGEMELKTLIDSSLREAVSKAVEMVNERFSEIPTPLVERLKSSVSPDPSLVETKTTHQAIDAFRKHLLKHGKRQDNGRPSPSVQNYLNIARRLKSTIDDFAFWELDKDRIDGLFAHWRNRPVSKRTKKPISADHAKHTMDCLWAMLVWIDESGGWNWELPRGARRVNRTPEMLDSDRKKRRSRRISGNIYDPEQLALIARSLDKFGKLILGVSVNCAMQPAEVGRLEVDDYYTEHPETGIGGDWIVFERPKTHEYGEWLLWPEVAELVQWGVMRAKDIGSERLIVSKSGISWYREDWSNPETRFSKWWQAIPTEKDKHIGVVTKLNRDVDGFPRHTIKWLRKILPNLVRPEYGKEIADLVNARRVDRSGRVAGRDTDRYADRLYDKASDAIMKLQDHFRPFLEALKAGDGE
ncbi:MAG: hypothetical protein NXI28_12485 [bacterium]|nr:hypothetical protein [bacterium]